MNHRIRFLALMLVLFGCIFTAGVAVSAEPVSDGPRTVRLVPQYCLARDRPDDRSRSGKSAGDTLDTCLIDGTLFDVLCRGENGYAFGPRLGDSLYLVEEGKCPKLVELMLERKPFTVILDGDRIRF